RWTRKWTTSASRSRITSSSATASTTRRSTATSRTSPSSNSDRPPMIRVFDIITETDARQIERGATVELAKGGQVTPLAQDTLRERRVTVVPAGSVDPALPPDLAPKSDIRRVAVASDHTGGALRKAIVQHLRGRAIEVNDLGGEGGGARRSGRRDRDRRGGHWFGDRGQQGARDPRRHGHRRDDRALLAAAQRRQRPGAGVVAAAARRRFAYYRRVVEYAHDRGALYPPAPQGSPARRFVLTH